MKKTIAAGSASLLGLTAVGFGATSAQAADDPVVTPCLTDADHKVTIGGVSSNWYMDCIPQYGTSGIGFWIESDIPFPPGFLDLDDPGVTSTATTGTAAVDYFGAPGTSAGFVDGPSAVIHNSQAQAYQGSLVLKINSVGSIPTASLPADCAAGIYTNAYEVTYAPATVTFSQLVNGEEWRYDVTVTPPPLYLGLSFAPANDGTFDPKGAMCAYGAAGPEGQASWYAESQAVDPDGLWNPIASLATDGFTNGDTLSPYFGQGKMLPDIARYVPPPPPKPELAATGVDPSGPLGVAALFLALGVAGGYLRRRRLARD